MKAKQLLGQFRKSDADDPDIFITAVTALLAAFPPCVVDHVCSPVTGMAVRSPWVPSIFDLREAAISHMNFLIAKHQLERIAPERLARITGRRHEDSPALQGIRLSKDELRAKYGGKLLPDNFGDNGVSDTRPKADAYTSPSLGEIIGHYQKNGWGIPLHRPMKEESNGQDHEEGHDEGVMADAVAEGSGTGSQERQADRRIEAPAQGRSGSAPQGARSVGIEADLDQESPPPREEGDPGPA